MTNQKKLFNRYKAEYKTKNPKLPFPKVSYFAQGMFGKKSTASNLHLWNRFMRGETKLLSLDSIKRFCELIEISSDELIYNVKYESVCIKFDGGLYNSPHQVHGEITGYGKRFIIFKPYGSREILIEKDKVKTVKEV